MKCFTNRKTINKDKFVSISLFKVKLGIENKKGTLDIDNDGHTHGGKLGQALTRVKTEKNGNVVIRVDKNSVKTSFAQGKALWVKFFEKAFESYRMANDSVTASCDSKLIERYIENWNNKKSEKILDGGTSDIVITAITGKTSYSILLQNTARPVLDKYSPNELAIYNTIKKKLAKGLAVMAGMKGKAENGNHMYSVIAVDEYTEPNDYLRLMLFDPRGKKENVGLKVFARDFQY